GAFSDYLDGFLARKHNIISDFGKIMDPLADKLLVLAALAAFTWLKPFNMPAFIFYTILIRELTITILREVYKKRRIIIPADKLGKIKTVMQMAGIVAALLLWALNPNLGSVYIIIIHAWFWVVAGITAFSGINYVLNTQKKGEER
ncbi:MAG: CDP-diacylglycerol--glycerol-3-phosphate 3-phosphatidyltransferase, partial [Candidatus Cloacimonadaceae bacterium]|nr:CDP-diacylglycerol--glycerol-3-phosphate 3-phosphatidyltransferase [Candidatus Cloacimonadaceae bacterium]